MELKQVKKVKKYKPPVIKSMLWLYDIASWDCS